MKESRKRLKEEKSLAPGGIWIHDLLITRRVLYRCATTAALGRGERSCGRSVLVHLKDRWPYLEAHYWIAQAWFAWCRVPIVLVLLEARTLTQLDVNFRSYSTQHKSLNAFLKFDLNEWSLRTWRKLNCFGLYKFIDRRPKVSTKKDSWQSVLPIFQSDQSHRPDLAGGHAEGGGGEEGRDQLLHVAEHQGLHEESHRGQPPSSESATFSLFLILDWKCCSSWLSSIDRSM